MENKDYLSKYSLSHLTLLGCSVPELVYIASRTGYDAISPRLIPMGVEGECPGSPIDREIMRATRNALKMTGIEVHDIEVAQITDDCDVKLMESAIEMGAEFGTHQLIASAWTTKRDNKNYLIDTYASLCNLANSYGLSVALEFPSFSRLRNLQETVEIVEGADQPNGGILIDTLYMHLSRVSLDEIDILPSRWFKFIHVCDAFSEIPETKSGMIDISRNARLYPGEGCINFEAIIEKLPPVDYSIEIPNKNRLSELGLEEHARQCLKASKRILESARSKKI